jgi:hypothetical protein
VSSDAPQSRALETHLQRAYAQVVEPLCGDEDCQWSGHCDEPQAYRVPSRGGNGSIGLCRRHLAVRRKVEPDLWARLVAHDPRLRQVAHHCGRYVGWADDLPPTRQLGEHQVERVALTDTGLGIYEDPPCGGSEVRYVLVDRETIYGAERVEADARDVARLIRDVQDEMGLAHVGGRWAEIYAERFAYACDPTEVHHSGGER